MSVPKASEIAGQIVDLLTPFSSDDRNRIFAAARALLGESATDSKAIAAGSHADETGSPGISAKAQAWQKQNGISADVLAQVFHSANGKTEVIAADMPGTNKKERTLNAYVLAGVARLLADGEPKFTDKDARGLCTTAGCYDTANHASTLKDKGNWFTGTKDAGWTLTAPGLKHGATLVKTFQANGG